MTITLELPPDLEARLLAEAAAKGIPIGEVVKAYLYKAPVGRRPGQLPSDEMDRLLDEAADLVPGTVPPLSDEAMSRDSIYTREDEWNR